MLTLAAALATAAPLLLGATFLAAGCLKAADQGSFRESVERLGVPAPRRIIIAVPGVELLIGVGLLVPSTTRFAAACALAVLLVFTLAVWHARRTQPHAECYCFGELDAGSSGNGLYIRNALLGGLALVVLTWPPVAGALPAGLTQTDSLAFAAIVCLAALLVDTRIKLTRLTAQRANDAASTAEYHDAAALGPQPGLAIGALVPDDRAVDAAGAPFSFRDATSRRDLTLVTFVAAGCPPCERLLPELVAGIGTVDPGSLLLVTHATASEARELAGQYPLSVVVVDTERALAKRFGAYGTPSAVLVGRDGVTTSRVVAGAKEIRALLSRMAPSRRPSPPTAVRQGRRLPPAIHAEPDAAPTSRAAASDPPTPKPLRVTVPTVAVFLSEGCVGCEALLALVARAQDAAPSRATPIQLVVAGGDPTFVPQQLQHTVVPDPDFEIGRTYGAPGTPSAVVVDESGVATSAVAIGAAAVSALAGLAPSGGSG